MRQSKRTLVLLFLGFVSTGLLADESKLEPKLIYEQDGSLLTTVVQIVVRTGSAQDPIGKTGLTNLVGELMLRGTKKRSRQTFQSELERLGAAIAVKTSHDVTLFVVQVIKENTLPVLEMVQEFLTSPALSKKEFAALKKEILSEIAHVKNSNNRLAGLALRRELFAGTALERPSDGTLSSVKAIQISDVENAYKNFLKKGNLVFGVASALPESQIQAWLTKLASGLPDGGSEKTALIEAKLKAKPSLVVVHKPKTSTGVIGFGQNGITAQDEMRYALAVGNFSFGGEPLVSRLFRLVRSELGWTYAINSNFGAFGHPSHQKGIFTISLTPSIEFTTKALNKVLELWKDYYQSGLKSDELRLAKESLVNSYPFEFETPEKRVTKKLHSYLYGVPIFNPEQFKETIEDISNSKIKDALKARQTLSGWVIVVVADADEFKKQWEEGQSSLPQDQRVSIEKRINPDQLIQ